MPRKLIKSFSYAGAGAAHAIRTQRNLWIHMGAGVLVLVWAAGLGVGRWEMVSLVLAITLVLAAEMINTSLEEVVNILSPEHRQAAALAKNVAAAAVLTAAIGTVVVGLLIFLPRVI